MKHKIDYSKYRMNAGEIFVGFMIGFVISFLYVNVILHKAAFAAVAGAVIGFVYLIFYKKKCMEKRRSLIVKQFKDLMESLVASYSAGGNHISAFENAYADMVELQGENACITKEIEAINTGIANGMTIESLLKDFARRVNHDDISNFVDVFIVCIRQGGDMRRVLYDTRITIMEKLDMEDEIAVQLRSSYNEFLILTAIPIVVDLFMQMDSTMKATGQSGVGVISRLIAVALCVIAYTVGKRIIHRVAVIFE